MRLKVRIKSLRPPGSKRRSPYMPARWAMKPRTSTLPFQGLGEEMSFLKEASEITGLPVVTEVMDIQTLPLVAEYADILQIKARNMQNFPRFHAVGEPRSPFCSSADVLNLEELLMSAEYILTHGNHRVILCERGIRTLRTPLVTPWISMPAGAENAPPFTSSQIPPRYRRWELVEPVSRAAVAAGRMG